MFERAGGLLLHLTSLPGGGIGPATDDFIRFLESAGQRWWQMLPVGPPGYGDSPYAALSAFAGDERLVPNSRPADRPVPAWLKEYGEFRALKDRYHQKPWWQWPKSHRADPERVRHYVERQFAFDDAWAALRRRANDAGVRLLGDLPLFVAKDSADVWAHRSLFDLDSVAGVPPDYFNADGQLWGNPQYDWPAHKRTKFRWWVSRLTACSNSSTRCASITSSGFTASGRFRSGRRRRAGVAGAPSPARRCSMRSGSVR